MGKKKKKNDIPVVGMETGDIILRVQSTRFYAIPKGMQYDLEHLIEDWFYRHDMDSYHAARQHYEIGYSERIDKVETVDMDTYREEIQKKIDQRKNLKDLCQWCRKAKDDVRRIELRWGATWDDADEHPLRYNLCPDCREKMKGYWKYAEAKKDENHD